MRVSDFYENGRRRWFRLLEKGGKHHEVPVHHRPRIYLVEYLEKAAVRRLLAANDLVEQVGSPDDICTKPATSFVASFVGDPPMSLVPSRPS